MTTATAPTAEGTATAPVAAPAWPGRAVVAGAGLAGSLAAIALARAGWTVTVIERRGDPRTSPEARGRSFNLGLSARGMAALEHVGLLDEVLAGTVPMRGRMIHTGGELIHQPYGTQGDEVLHSLERADLNALLVERASALPGVGFEFGQVVVDVDAAAGTLTVRDDATGTTRVVEGDLVVGADGAFSAVRASLERQGLASTTTDQLAWGYKELTIPVGDDGRPRTPIEALHVWPGERGLIVAHPNRDGSLTATLFLDHEGATDSFATLTDDASVEAYFRTSFPDTETLVPDRVREFLDHPVGRLVTVRTAPWVHGDRLVLVGDACHAVYPFYGQGMNASFEDVLVLSRCLAASPGDRAGALADYQERRKRHTDALAELSEQNFYELRDRVRSPWFRVRKRADLLLHRAFPRAWVPLYTMIAHRTTPYDDARARARRQDLVLGGALAGAASGIVGLAVAAVRRTGR